ncbi:hypothetical protein NSND_62598 [Nitrospira sp. ND1]|nr:hypothetical protein NSND_62598 [Nitrospira sp. ND1]
MTRLSNIARPSFGPSHAIVMPERRPISQRTQVHVLRTVAIQISPLTDANYPNIVPPTAAKRRNCLRRLPGKPANRLASHAITAS